MADTGKRGTTGARILAVLVAAGSLGFLLLWMLPSSGEGTQSVARHGAAASEEQASAQVDLALEATARKDGATRTPGARAEVQANSSPDGSYPLHLFLRSTCSEALEPLPDFLIELQGDSLPAPVIFTSDAHGIVSSERLFPAGHYELRCLDHPAHAGEMEQVAFEHPGKAGTAIELVLKSGPTFALLIDKPETLVLDQLRAVFEGDNAGRFGGGLLNPAYRKRESRVRQGALRGQVQPWVRFPFVAPDYVRYELSLESIDSMWRGEVRAPRSDCLQGEPLSITLYERGALQVDIGFSEEARFYGIEVHLVLLAGQGFIDEPHELGSDWSRTHYNTYGLRYGEYELSVVSPRTKRVRRLISIDRAFVKEKITLTALPFAGDVSGLVHTNEAELPDAELHLIAVDDPERRFELNVRWKVADGESTAPFVFKDVPAGIWKLSVSANAWELCLPRSIELHAPAEELEFTVQSAGKRIALAIEVQDAQTGLPLRDMQIMVSNGMGSETGVWNANSGMIVAPAIPRSGPVTWTIKKKGYKTLTGTGEAFGNTVWRDGREVWVAKVALQPD